MTPIFKLEYNPNSSSVKSPIDNEYITLLLKKCIESTTTSASEKSYRLTFPKGSSKKLMIHRSGELMGLKTTSITENGKIKANAGLEEVFEKNEYKILSLALFGIVDGYFKEINFTLQKIYQIQQFEIQAKFERITYVLENTFDILPELLVDRTLHTPYLNQIVDSNSNCYELFSFLKQEFKIKCKKSSNETFNDNSYFQDKNRLHHLSKLLDDNVYATLERFAFGKVCEMLLSGNFTSSYVDHTKKQISGMIEELIGIIKTATYDEESFREKWQQEIDNCALSKQERDLRENELATYIKKYNEIIDNLRKKLSFSVEGLFHLSSYIDEKDICILIKDGDVYIEK
ncbi:hypothetical protein ACEUBW_20205 [Aeromonas veronii]|uniref:hypothetical protein n=1 Tax=Aeromonas veronii TaxID=654 RepID=UPI0038D715F9